jgi:hypothetical protein
MAEQNSAIGKELRKYVPKNLGDPASDHHVGAPGGRSVYCGCHLARQSDRAAGRDRLKNIPCDREAHCISAQTIKSNIRRRTGWGRLSMERVDLVTLTIVPDGRYGKNPLGLYLLVCRLSARNRSHARCRILLRRLVCFRGFRWEDVVCRNRVFPQTQSSWEYRQVEPGL